MKIWTDLFVLGGMLGLFAACGDDDQWLPGDIPGKGETAVYSNKLSAPQKGNTLVLTYDGGELIGKEVALSVEKDGMLSLSLRGILPGEPETQLTGLSLQSTGEGFIFEGRASGKLGTTFAYRGKVGKGQLKLDLTEVRIPANFLADAGTWSVVKTDSEPKVDSVVPHVGGVSTYKTISITGYGRGVLFSGADMGNLVGMIAGNLVNSVLREVTFHPDGRISAVYADFPQKENLLGDLMNAGVARTEDEWKTSPSENLASYYMADDTTLCVTPNVDMIIRQIEAGSKTTRAGEEGLPATLKKLYDLLNAWTTTGIRLVAKELPADRYVKDGDVYQQFAGDLSIAVGAKELQPLIELLGSLPVSVLEKEIKLMGIPMKVGDLLKMIEITQDFSLWIYFDRTQEMK